MCVDKINNIVNKFNNLYPQTIKMKPVDVNSGTYIDFVIENNEKNNEKVGDHVGISKHIYKYIFCKRLCSLLLWRSFCL